ncbi:MAG TPA: hypothetical protein VFR53_00530 [Methylomirabilota bacterium]|nr:hypothetical protein [Methylomirabilota bacterium]
MTRTNWIAGTCLGLLLIGGAAVDARAQQPPAAPAPVEAPQTPAPQTPDSTPPRPQTEPARPQTEYGGQPSQAPPTGSQIDTRPAPRAEREPGAFLGVDSTLAMILGAVLVVVVVIGIVAMSRRGDEVRDPHRRHQV